MAEPPQTSQESGTVKWLGREALASWPRPFGAPAVLPQTNAFPQLAEVEVEVEIDLDFDLDL